MTAAAKQHATAIADLKRRLNESAQQFTALESKYQALATANIELKRERDTAQAELTARTTEHATAIQRHKEELALSAAKHVAATTAAAQARAEAAAAAAAAKRDAASNHHSKQLHANPTPNPNPNVTAAAGGGGAGGNNPHHHTTISTSSLSLLSFGDSPSRRPGKAALTGAEPPISASAWARRTKQITDRLRAAELELGEAQVTITHRQTECDSLRTRLRDAKQSSDSEIAAATRRIRAAVQKESDEAAAEIDHLQSENALLKEMLHSAKVDLRRLMGDAAPGAEGLSATAGGGSSTAALLQRLTTAPAQVHRTTARTVTTNAPSAGSGGGSGGGAATATDTSASAAPSAAPVIPPIPITNAAFAITSNSTAITTTASPKANDSKQSSSPPTATGSSSARAAPVLSYGKLRGAAAVGASPRSGRVRTTSSGTGTGSSTARKASPERTRKPSDSSGRFPVISSVQVTETKN